MYVSEECRDFLNELINIGVGRAASTLNSMLSCHVRLDVPYVEILSPADLAERVLEAGDQRISAVRLDFSGAISGSVAEIFPTESAAKLVSLMTEESESDDLDSIHVGTLTEIGNIVLNAVMGSIANTIRQQLIYSVPTYREGRLADILTSDSRIVAEAVVWARTHFHIEQREITGDFVLVFEADSLDILFAGSALSGATERA